MAISKMAVELYVDDAPNAFRILELSSTKLKAFSVDYLL